MSIFDKVPYEQVIDNLVNADLKTDNYRDLTVEEVLQEYEKFMATPDIEGELEVSEFNYTRLTFFEASADGVVPYDQEKVIESTGFKKVLGDVYFDETDGVLIVMQRVSQLDNDLFVNEEGNVFSIQIEEDVPERLTDDKG